MGACQSTPENKQIDRHLKEHERASKQESKLLLLGAGSSGKSTLFRQLHAIFSGAFSRDELEEFAATIRQNCVFGILLLAEQSQRLYELDAQQNADCYIDLSVVDAEICDAIKHVASFAKTPFEHYEDDAYEAPQKRERMTRELDLLGQHIELIWRLPQIEATYRKRFMFHYNLPDNRDYFYAKVREAFTFGYVPSFDDYLRCRIRTNTITQETFNATNGEGRFSIYDVGGQRNERKKWINQFQGVTAVVFVAALNHYATVIFEDATKNAMVESLELFFETCNSRWFRRTEIILFLNKDDLFQRVIRCDTPLSVGFNEQNGCIWKKEYVGDANYAPLLPFLKIYNAGTVPPSLAQVHSQPRNNNEADETEIKTAEHDHGATHAKLPSQSLLSKQNSTQSVQSVYDNERNSVSFASQSHDAVMSPFSADDYVRQPAIYPKPKLRLSAKNTWENGKWADKTDDEWFSHVYTDYLYFIAEQYQSMNLQRAKKRIFVHVTTATDNDNITRVFWDVQNIIIRGNMFNSGML